MIINAVDPVQSRRMPVKYKGQTADHNKISTVNPGMPQSAAVCATLPCHPRPSPVLPRESP